MQAKGLVLRYMHIVCEIYVRNILKEVKEIAVQFNLAHYGGVSSAIHHVKKMIGCNGELALQINSIINRLVN